MGLFSSLKLKPKTESKPEPVYQAPVALPVIRTYGNYSSDNYGAHCLQVVLPRLTLYFSYKTIVGFRADEGTVISENVWGPTTGKHLNFLDGGHKEHRLPRGEFEDKLQATLKKLGMAENL